MSRPLQLDSIFDLDAMAERNRGNRAELELIRSELNHRKTAAAMKLRERIDIWTMQWAQHAPDSAAEGETMMDASATTPLDEQTCEWTYEAVAKLRAKLIDLSRKSPLIAFKHTSRSASQLRFVDERIDLLFERLCKGSMAFEPLPGEEQTPKDERTAQFGIAYERARLTDEEFLAATEKLGQDERDARPWQDAERTLRARVRAALGLPKLEYGKSLDVVALAKAHGFDPSYDLKSSDAGEVAAHHEDDSIRVLLSRKELDRRVKSIAGKATSHLRETGHHTLHLAFGFVQWFEDDASDVISHAPLLLLPVAIERDQKGPRKDFRLLVWEGGLEVNVALIEKARDHWGLQLPKLRDEETPESYFIRAKTVLDQGQRLSLRTFVTLSVLPPMILWRDLDPEKWPENGFAEHRLLPGLIGATEVAGVDGDDTVFDIDDPVHASRVPALITDADASQHRAIMDMAAGRDMAIEGPPGTGKSQTITNMIATALEQGKRVLFVAEKQAALRVVSERLRAAGFGPLLLELHGDKASRSEVYAGLRERLDARPRHDARELEEKRSELRRHRDLLRRYLSLVRKPLGKLGRTAHGLAWREIRLRQLFARGPVEALEAKWAPAEPLDLDRAAMSENRELLEQFGKALLAVDAAQGATRTDWTLAGRLDPFDQAKALTTAAEAARAAGAVEQMVDGFAVIGIRLPGPEEPIQAATAQLSRVLPLSSADEAMVRTVLHKRGTVTQLIETQQEWCEQLDLIAEDVERPDNLSDEVIEALGDALAIERCPGTLHAVELERAQTQSVADLATAAVRDLDRLGGKLDCGLQTTLGKAADVARTLAELGGAEAAVGALLSSALLDTASDGVISSAKRDAAALLAEQGEVASLAQSEAFIRDPSELEGAAEVLESTPVLARLFSGQYKRTKRQAARLLIGDPDREQSAAVLRRTLALLRARQSFYDTSKARALFPAMLWEGIGSDFASLGAAYGLITGAAARLAAVDETGVLRWWLAADATERRTFSSACDRLNSVFKEAEDAGFGATPLGDLLAASLARVEALRSLENASVDAGVRRESGFKRAGGGTIVDALIKLNTARDRFEQFRRLDELRWVGPVDVSLEALQQCVVEMDAVIATAGPLDLPALLAEAAEPASLLRAIVDAAKDLPTAFEGWERASDALRGTAELDITTLCEGLDWRSAKERLMSLSADRQGASLAADLLKYRSAVVARGLEPLAEAAAAGEVPPELLDDMYELLATSAVLRWYLGADGQDLGRLGSLALDAARQSFRRVDKELHKLEAAAIVAKRLTDKPPTGVGHGRRSDFTELRLLENEVGLTRPRTPLRDVAHRGGAALQALKPVWMMSPTSIAQFIRPGSLNFDLLIVDEASQMRPEFSVSCIMRADQFVVVGDANQLPPSDHFQIAGVDSDEDADGVGIDESTESILDLANQRFRTKPRLKWHYRSQHESLIQFSNREFYDRDLVIFPSPMANDDELLGVKCVYAPSIYSDTTYEASLNQREAELTIEEAFGLMQTHPERSIGIVAMNAKQTELIQNEFDRLVVEDERVREYVDAFAGTIDEFFIKNLENVQGDERDIILISTVYGPDKNGTVRQNFGLMNREVGWRRLNVLVTRAKMSCRLITSLRPDDVKVTENSSRGVIAFKSYLTYAHGGAHYGDASGGETDSDFEIFVADALRGAGYEVVYQVGVENFRIDLGVRHSSCPVGFIAGIECDGAPYHSGLSVRDRDHIRQTVLENLGWNIYRVWSTDWFADPARETAKMLVWLEGVCERIAGELADQVRAPESSKLKPKSPPVLSPAVDEMLDAASTKSPLVNAPSQAPEEESPAGPREPRGRELRSIGDFRTYEAVRGKLYEIWMEDAFLGDVAVLKRATAAPRLFGSRALTDQSEYEGRVEATDDYFRSFDLYAAMREVASRATAANVTKRA